jgi:hypothetical protein
MKFLEKYNFEVVAILAFTMSTVILWATVDEAPDYFYIKHLITCVGAFILIQATFNLVYSVCKKIKR